MSEGAIVIIVTQVITLVLAVIGFLHSARAIQDVHVSLNSRLSQLLLETEKASHAAGMAEATAARLAQDESQKKPSP
jgi:hypothetical protein